MFIILKQGENLPGLFICCSHIMVQENCLVVKLQSHCGALSEDVFALALHKAWTQRLLLSREGTDLVQGWALSHVVSTILFLPGVALSVTLEQRWRSLNLLYLNFFVINTAKGRD